MSRHPDSNGDNSMWRTPGPPDTAGVDDLRRVAAQAGDARDRRSFLKMVGASLGAAGMSTLAGGLAGCHRRSPTEIVPYVNTPEYVIPGKPVDYASTLLRDGYGVGVLVESHEGRPTKIEGNPDHPASLGAADARMQAATMQLYDPDRSPVVLAGTHPSTWSEFTLALERQRVRWEARQGEGLRLLTPLVTSPSLGARIDALLERCPKARWHQWQALNADQRVAGARLAFGRDVDASFRLEGTDVVLQLDGDFLSELPGSLRYAREFAQRRDPQRPMSRLYAIESTPGLAGAVADHTLPAVASRVSRLAARLAAELGMPLPQASGASALTPDEAHWLQACARDLDRHRGRSLVIAGDNQPAGVHALAHWLNYRLGNAGTTVVYHEPVAHRVEPMGESLAGLVQAMQDGEVDTLVTLGCNPVYDAPADLNFGAALERVGFSIHHGPYVDETAQRSGWHVPLTHELESWGDARAFDGTVSVQQPLIRPLFGGHSPYQLLAQLLGRIPDDDRTAVRQYWKDRMPDDFERRWFDMLRAGVVPDSAAETISPELDAAAVGDALTRKLSEAPPTDGGFTLQFRGDPRIGDGSQANNAWLLELPRPLSKLTWDNALLVGTATAQQRGWRNGDVVTVETGGRTIEAPVWIVAGHPENAGTLPLGFGRSIRTGEGGALANGYGVDAYPLRRRAGMYFTAATVSAPTGERRRLATTQHHDRMEGRPVVRHGTLAAFEDNPRFVADDPRAHDPDISLYPEPMPEPFDIDTYAWGMAIDLNACIGCGACTMACQVENNIPVVGKDQVLAGREMHWIRIDRYYQGPPDRPDTFFQPVPCQHCENAPCEYVCPVGATQHDSEGLNVMIYNRCIGTRDCSQNCPYKVRRFNFLEYNFGTERAEMIAPLRNPDVTVRSRGVMEKCTYCLQRISEARREAKKEGRPIRDGEVRTACQQTCPTRAIVFGDQSDPSTAVSRAKAHPLDYHLLAELNTRPRTSYRARISNPNPELSDTGPAGAVERAPRGDG